MTHCATNEPLSRDPAAAGLVAKLLSRDGAADITNVGTYCSNCSVKLTATHRLKPSSNAKSHLGRITSIASLQSGD